MKTKWSIEENRIVCEFYLNHQNDWKDHFNDLKKELNDKVWHVKSDRSLKYKILNCMHLNNEGGLSHASEDNKIVFNKVVKKD